MVGTYRMSFKATTNDCGGTNSNNDATGGVCKAFVKVINSSDFSQILFDSVETQGASGETMNLDFEITEAMVGHIYQSGFMNTASNYAPTSMFYDDVVVAAYTPEPTPAPTPAPEDGTLFTETMADYSADSENLAPWTAYINRYDADGNYQNGYSVSPAPNGPQISAWATGEEGSDNDDGTGYLNAYSNYDDSHHQSGIMETNLYAEFTITEDMVGDITASFIAKRPETASNACGGANADNGATGATCAAFVKILNPSNNYATELFTTLDMTEISSTEWSSHVITATIAAGDVGKLIQFGSQNTATNYAPTGVYYDNMNVSKATSAGTAQDLFISEMGEGPSGTGSWGKYLEIANFTGAEVSVDGYILGKITNGGDPYESYVNFASGATIANGDVYVIGRATSSDADAPADLVDNIDEVNSFISHNGDDAYGLLKGTSDSYTVMDVFGPEGTYTDPGAAHTACGDAETRDSSWMKKADKEGTTSWATSAGTSAEDCHWTITTYDSSTLDYSTVGSHTFTGSGD